MRQLSTSFADLPVTWILLTTLIFASAWMLAQSGRGETRGTVAIHNVVVPYEKALELAVEGRGLQVDDESGKRLRKSDPPQRFQVARGQPPKPFRFTVQ